MVFWIKAAYLTPIRLCIMVTIPDIKRLVLIISAITTDSVEHMAGSRINVMDTIPPNAIMTS